MKPTTEIELKIWDKAFLSKWVLGGIIKQEEEVEEGFNVGTSMAEVIAFGGKVKKQKGDKYG